MTLFIQQIEGASLLIAGILILFTLRRKGRNRLLNALGWFFIGGALFRFGMILSSAVVSLSGVAQTGVLAGIIANSCLYYGVAVYVSVQLGFLGGQRWQKRSLGIGLFLATLLLLFHLAASGFIPGPWSAFDAWQVRVMLTVFAVSAALLLGLWLWFPLRLWAEGFPVTAPSTVHAGLGLMLVSWILQKIVQADIGSTSSFVLSSLPFFAIAIVIGAVLFQTSAAMTPGIVRQAVSKQPIPLAVVRVFRKENNKLLESRVTSAEGRYGILVEPGAYILDVTAKGFRFPTSGTLGYRGEEILIKKPTLIGFDIFLDPIAS